MAYQVQNQYTNHPGSLFPKSCMYIPLTIETIAAMLARGAMAMNQLSKGTWARTPKHQKLQAYWLNISQAPDTTPQFFNVKDGGQGLWRVPSFGTVNGGHLAEAMVCIMLDLQPRWGIAGRGVGQHPGDIILQGPLSEIELYDISNGRFPPTLAELGIPAPGVCDGTSIMPGRPRQSMMDPEPTPPRPRAPAQAPVYDPPRRALNLTRPPPRQSRPLTLRSPPQATRPRRPPPTLIRPLSPSSSSSSSDSSSDSSSSEEEKKPKKAAKKKEVAAKKGKGKAKTPAKRRPAAPPSEDDDDDEAVYSAEEKRGPKPSRIRRDEGVAPPRARAGPSKQAPAAGRPRPRRVERSDNEGEDAAAPRPSRRPPAAKAPEASSAATGGCRRRVGRSDDEDESPRATRPTDHKRAAREVEAAEVEGEGDDEVLEKLKAMNGYGKK
ncbi:MAG: hypothetical protein LQ350_000155 [Teloschistes chrysophthalmus]|nr:MAG: hypothetical protein LQ350_000155 [Niorma chrysophthalma]